MLQFEWKSMNQLKGWNLITKLRIGRNVGKCWNVICQIDQNVAIWVLKYEAVRRLKFVDKTSNNWLKCWNFSA